MILGVTFQSYLPLRHPATQIPLFPPGLPDGPDEAATAVVELPEEDFSQNSPARQWAS